MKNMIFDMGNVLIRFEPELFVQRETELSAEDRMALLNGIFLTPEWPMMDSGELDEVSFEALVRTRLPERLHAAAHRMIYWFEPPLLPVPGMADVARDCKRRGMGVYLLSNATVRQPEYWPRIPGSEVFDGAVISAIEHCVKPDAKIYHILLERYHLNPAGCLFADDTLPNVEAARSLGMQAFHFTGDVAALRQAVEQFVER